MSYSYPGEQVEHAFVSHRLQNWEVPASKKQGSSADRFGTLKQPNTGMKTQFIANDKGYVEEDKLPSGTVKLSNSFNHAPPVYMKNPARWPNPNPAIIMTETATMGYKGIKTAHLPNNTTTIKAVELPGSKERNFNFQ
eukprot:gene23698-9239_t